MLYLQLQRGWCDPKQYKPTNLQDTKINWKNKTRRLEHVEDYGMSGLIRRVPPRKLYLCHLLFAQLQHLGIAPFFPQALQAYVVSNKTAVAMNLQTKQQELTGGHTWQEEENKTKIIEINAGSNDYNIPTDQKLLSFI